MVFFLTTNLVSGLSVQIIPTGMKMLHTHIPVDQLTEEFGGTLSYDHGDWVDMFLVSNAFLIQFLAGLPKRWLPVG